MMLLLNRIRLYRILIAKLLQDFKLLDKDMPVKIEALALKYVNLKECTDDTFAQNLKYKEMICYLVTLLSKNYYIPLPVLEKPYYFSLETIKDSLLIKISAK